MERHEKKGKQRNTIKEGQRTQDKKENTITHKQ